MNDRFTALQRTLHWLMGVCILVMLFIGVGMVSTVTPTYLRLLSLHKPLGIAILVLALIRLIVRRRSGTPALPADLPAPIRIAAHLSHYVLYALMIAMPLIGWGMLAAADLPVIVFGVHLPTILPPYGPLHAELRIWHGYLAFAFFALILMHLAAALFHALVRRDGVFSSMAPWSWNMTSQGRLPDPWSHKPGMSSSELACQKEPVWTEIKGDSETAPNRGYPPRKDLSRPAGNRVRQRFPVDRRQRPSVSSLTREAL